MSDNDFVYSLDDEYFMEWDEFMDMVESDFEIGDTVRASRGYPVDVEHSNIVEDFIKYDFISMLQERAYDEYGEWAEDYLTDVTEEQLDKLSKLVIRFMNDNFKNPTWFRVDDIEDYEFVYES